MVERGQVTPHRRDPVTAGASAGDRRPARLPRAAVGQAELGGAGCGGAWLVECLVCPGEDVAWRHRPVPAGEGRAV